MQASRSVYTPYCEAARRSPLSRFSKTIFSSSRLSELANDDMLVRGPRILPLHFETVEVPAASSTPSTPACSAKYTAEEPRTPIQASRYCHTQYSEAVRRSLLSRRSKVPSQHSPPHVNDDVAPVLGSCVVPSRTKVIEVPAVWAAPSMPVHQVKARGEEEPCVPIQVCVRISTSSFSQANLHCRPLAACILHTARPHDSPCCLVSLRPFSLPRGSLHLLMTMSRWFQSHAFCHCFLRRPKYPLLRLPQPALQLKSPVLLSRPPVLVILNILRLRDAPHSLVTLRLLHDNCLRL